MVRIRREDETFGDGVDVDRLARAHLEVRRLEEVRDRVLLLHANDITEAQRAEAACDRSIERTLEAYDLTPERYERIMEVIRSDPVLHGILREAVQELSENGRAGRRH